MTLDCFFERSHYRWRKVGRIKVDGFRRIAHDIPAVFVVVEKKKAATLLIGAQPRAPKNRSLRISVSSECVLVNIA
jgi:hypothetical protein